MVKIYTRLLVKDSVIYLMREVEKYKLSKTILIRLDTIEFYGLRSNEISKILFLLSPFMWHELNYCTWPFASCNKNRLFVMWMQHLMQMFISYDKPRQGKSQLSKWCGNINRIIHSMYDTSRVNSVFLHQKISFGGVDNKF